MYDAAPSGPGTPADLTELMSAFRAGQEGALDGFASVVYEELRQIAHRQLLRERPGHTLQTTGLVHEAFAKFVGLDRIQLADRAHFFALSARIMRQILIDYAKRRRALKRDGAATLLAGGRSAGEGVDLEGLIDLDRALDKLAGVSERCARIIECRFFAGMTVKETAVALGVSPATVKRDWELSRAWLNRELAVEPTAGYLHE